MTVCMTPSYSEAFVFVRPLLNREITTLGTVFDYMCFWYPKTSFTCGPKAKAGKKFPFLKISGYVWKDP